jgi:hypothetical protein
MRLKHLKLSKNKTIGPCDGRRRRGMAVAGLALFLSLCSLARGQAAQTASNAASAEPTTRPRFWSFAPIPPMGWNSYDAFGDSVTEAEVLANARYLKDHLLSHGWNTVVVDYRWYDGGADSGALSRRAGATLAMDSHGRLLPAPNRFPSCRGDDGFAPLAAQIHAMGLKFGIHVMRGIARQAVKRNCPIEGSAFAALRAANLASTCEWCPDMFGIDLSGPAGQAWYDSLFAQYARWGVDYVKVDDLSRPYHAGEIGAIRTAIDRSGRAMIFSTSPGEAPVRDAADIAAHANLWRMSDDFWDNWKSLDHNFDLLGRWQGVGGPGHWPDADMIPLGHLALRSVGRPRMTQLSHDEQVTLMSLWALAPSPLMLGMNLPDDDAWTDSLLSNDAVIAVNQDSLGAAARRVGQDRAAGTEVWIKPLSGGRVAAGLFNRSSVEKRVTLNAAELPMLSASHSVHDHLTGQRTQFSGEISALLAPHAAMLVQLEQ